MSNNTEAPEFFEKMEITRRPSVINPPIQESNIDMKSILSYVDSNLSQYAEYRQGRIKGTNGSSNMKDIMHDLCMIVYESLRGTNSKDADIMLQIDSMISIVIKNNPEVYQNNNHLGFYGYLAPKILKDKQYETTK